MKRLVLITLLVLTTLAIPPSVAQQAEAETPEYYAVSAADLQLIITLVQDQKAEIKRLKDRLAQMGCT